MQLGHQVSLWRENKDLLPPHIVQALNERKFVWDTIGQMEQVMSTQQIEKSTLGEAECDPEPSKDTAAWESNEAILENKTLIPDGFHSIYEGYAHTNEYAFTEKEDEHLRQVLWGYGSKFSVNSEASWLAVAGCIPSRNSLECRSRWLEMQNTFNAKKTGWVSGEDTMMQKIVAIRGAGNWRLIACYIPGRTFKQCRERWHNHLDPEVNKGPWTSEESNLVIDKQRIYGNKWARIAGFLPGRTDNLVKNHWYSGILPRSKKERGVLPKTRGVRSKEDLSMLCQVVAQVEDVAAQEEVAVREEVTQEEVAEEEVAGENVAVQEEAVAEVAEDDVLTGDDEVVHPSIAD